MCWSKVLSAKAPPIITLKKVDGLKLRYLEGWCRLQNFWRSLTAQHHCAECFGMHSIEIHRPAGNLELEESSCKVICLRRNAFGNYSSRQ